MVCLVLAVVLQSHGLSPSPQWLSAHPWFIPVFKVINLANWMAMEHLPLIPLIILLAVVLYWVIRRITLVKDKEYIESKKRRRRRRTPMPKILKELAGWWCVTCIILVLLACIFAMFEYESPSEYSYQPPQAPVTFEESLGKFELGLMLFSLVVFVIMLPFYGLYKLIAYYICTDPERERKRILERHPPYRWDDNLLGDRNDDLP
jgi:hypothetical protein